MYKVIGTPQSRALRVIWVLEELGEDYTLDPAFPQTDIVRANNSTGKIPVLIDGDDILTDSIAICTYLADKHGNLTFPAGSIERARQDSFTQFAVDELEGALWTAAKNTFVHPEDIRVPAVKNVCKIEFAKALKTLEERLGNKPYVMGNTFTIADIIIGHCSGWATSAKFDLPETGTIADYFQRLRERPAYQSLLEKMKTPS
ncbi:glutathione S-transferase family protein [Roseibium algae]|uniref:Glutathione S-transferase family protein n=1 Tax=Roseibium algae TaxID=3123038 RepID=A0ABU8TL97_9HYPH